MIYQDFQLKQQQNQKFKKLVHWNYLKIVLKNFIDKKGFW